jgi:ABC-type multidrug transport system fused ATPase/permease subunit
MSSGMAQVPDHVYPIIEAFSVEYEEREKEKKRLKENYVFKVEEALDITKLVEVHDLLSQTIAPATPRAVLLLDPIFADKTMLSWISPVALLRRLMIMAFFSLVGFIAIALSPYVAADGGDIFHSDGIPLFVNLMFFVFSASLGACFAALFQANNYIIAGVFDPKYEPSYWIRLLVGIMAGLILASLIPIDPEALNGLGHPTLSLLGGFSASLVYRILNLLVSMVEDMVKRMSSAMLGSNKEEKAKE